MGAVTLPFGIVTAFANVYSTRCLARRKRRMICLLTAGFNCLNVPFGLILGVYSFLVLLRPSVEDLFEDGKPVEDSIIEVGVAD